MGGGGGGGGEGMDMEVEVPLSTGALEAMWQEDGLRPVLQQANAPVEKAGRFLIALSDGGARPQPWMLAASLSHLVARGTVACVLEYVASIFHDQR